MWKAVGSVHDGDDRSIRSNKSRIENNPEPFHQSLKRKSNCSPETNRSFCQDYFQKRRNNTINMTTLSNKEGKPIKSLDSRDDLVTQLRYKASKDQRASRMSRDDNDSRLDSLRENPEGRKPKKGVQQLKKTTYRLHNLKKDHSKLRKNLENEFDSFKNFFYQLEEKIHQQCSSSAQESTAGLSLDEELLKGLIGQALQVQRFFGEMDRKKAAIMQQLSG